MPSQTGNIVARADQFPHTQAVPPENSKLASAESPHPDAITSIPHFNGELCFQSFSGYLATSTGAKSLFYWYHEATSSPTTAPLVLWLNGGPGCSSLGGMFTENGPFVLDKNLTITLNPYSWNKVANVLYIEQPAGVGFSYPAGSTNDTITSQDTYEALLAFLERHPVLKGRDFYIAGESYGGHYVPNLAKRIQDGGNPVINLKGFAVGNAYTDWALDFSSNVPFSRFHALTSPALYEGAMKACAGDTARCFWPRPGVECPEPCLTAVAKAVINAMDGSIDQYDIYEDVCTEGRQRLATQVSRLVQERHRQIARRAGMGATVISPIFGTCADVYTAGYLNLPEVQKAIHVVPETIPKGRWQMCGLHDLYEFNYESVLPLYRRWVQDQQLKILVYSGDTDFIVNFLGTENWVSALNLPVKSPWRRWHGSDRQVAGYYEEYVGLTFLTVKGAGHMVPKDRPRHALDMFSSFLRGRQYDSVKPVPHQQLCESRG